MSDPFSSSKRRIARAKMHIHDLKGKADSFLKDNPCSHVVEPDTDGINNLHKIKFRAVIPDSFGEIAADALENIRAALDQAGYAVAVAAGANDPEVLTSPLATTQRISKALSREDANKFRMRSLRFFARSNLIKEGTILFGHSTRPTTSTSTDCSSPPASPSLK